MARQRGAQFIDANALDEENSKTPGSPDVCYTLREERHLDMVVVGDGSPKASGDGYVGR